MQQLCVDPVGFETPKSPESFAQSWGMERGAQLKDFSALVSLLSQCQRPAPYRTPTAFSFTDATPFRDRVSGHHIMFVSNSMLCKETTQREVQFYERIDTAVTSRNEDQHTPAAVALAPFIPRYFGAIAVEGSSRLSSLLRQLELDLQSPQPIASASPVEIPEHVASLTLHEESTRSHSPMAFPSSPLMTQQKMRYFLVLEDLADGMKHPCVLDIKMGVRGYGIGAAGDKKSRKKERSQSTTSHKHGVRMCGMKLYHESTQRIETLNKYEGRKLTSPEFNTVLRRFLKHQPQLAASFLKLVDQLLGIFMWQNAFRFYTASLLFVYDSGDPVNTAQVKIVDFAYTYSVDEVQSCREDDGETPGGEVRDEGFVLGLKTLHSLLTEVVRCTNAMETLDVGVPAPHQRVLSPSSTSDCSREAESRDHSPSTLPSITYLSDPCSTSSIPLVP